VQRAQQLWDGLQVVEAGHRPTRDVEAALDRIEQALDQMPA
jgi:hypothetical protein